MARRLINSFMLFSPFRPAEGGFIALYVAQALGAKPCDSDYQQIPYCHISGPFLLRILLALRFHAISIPVGFRYLLARH
jgi:hypothetical protein